MLGVLDKIICGTSAIFWAVVKQPYSMIALQAKESADSSSLMAMVYNKASFSFWALTDPTFAVLLDYKRHISRFTDGNVQFPVIIARFFWSAFSGFVSAWSAPDVKSIRSRCIADKIDDRPSNPTLAAPLPLWIWLSSALFLPSSAIFTFLPSAAWSAPTAPHFSWTHVALKIAYRSFLSTLRAGFAIHVDTLLCRGLE